MQEELNLFPSRAALEALCGWSDPLKSFQQRLGKYYARSEARQAAFDYIQALLCSVERKNGWQMSERVGYVNPYRFQHHGQSSVTSSSLDKPELCLLAEFLQCW